MTIFGLTTDVILVTDTVQKKLLQIISVLDSLVEDSSVPRNVRARLGDARAKLGGEEAKSDLPTALSSAIYALDEISNDINLPTHARTMVWNLLSELEALKQEVIQEN